MTMTADLVAQKSHVNLQRVGLAANELKVVLCQGRLKRGDTDGIAFMAIPVVREYFLNGHLFPLVDSYLLMVISE